MNKLNKEDFIKSVWSSDSGKHFEMVHNATKLIDAINLLIDKVNKYEANDKTK